MQVNEEEAKFRKIEGTLNMYKDNLKELQEMESSVEIKNEDIDHKIK